MKRLINMTETQHLPTFGDYRRKRLPEPFRRPTAMEEEILKKAPEATERTSADTIATLQDDEPHHK